MPRLVRVALLVVASVLLFDSAADAVTFFKLKGKRIDGGGILCEGPGRNCIGVVFADKPIGDPKWEAPESSFKAAPAGTMRVVLDGGNVELIIKNDLSDFDFVE